MAAMEHNRYWCSNWPDCLNQAHRLFGHRSSNVLKGVLVVRRSFGHSGPGKSASVQVYSRTQVGHNPRKGKLSEHAHLKDGKKSKQNGFKIITYKVKFYLDQEFGIPGALLITSHHKHQFFLLSATLQLTNTNDHYSVHFECNSWIYPINKTSAARLFFSNSSYLPNQTPEALKDLREEELERLRGDGQGKRMEWERIYDYDVYNDLGDPDHGDHHVRPILGGTKDFPYPRRVRTGRPHSETDNRIESRARIISLDTYVPADERFSPVKFSEFITHSIAAIVHFLIPEANSMFQGDPGFESFKQIYEMFQQPRHHHELEGWLTDKIKNMVPKDISNEFFRLTKDNTIKFQVPQIIAANQMAWRDDEEFGRETLAGLNPAAIECLKIFPPTNSLIRARHIEPNLEGKTVISALEQRRLFILDHHHYLLPYLEVVNREGVCVYASRTIFFRRDDNTMKPVAIELTRPAPDQPDVGVSRVFIPAAPGSADRALWQLAKAHVAANDSAHHQLISHWLKTHAVVEPFVIATKRQLSVMHPVHKLLDPHFKDTMFINSLARTILINSEGILERTVFPGKFCMALSSSFYGEHWKFHEQAHPVDLVKRGMAVEDPTHFSGIRLLFDDYPYGADGLDVWMAIRQWVTAYCSVYYPNDTAVSSDAEIQAWWSEVQHTGHGDKSSAEDWRPLKLLTVPELMQTLTTLIWIASALHASVNFGQYGYGGFLPNRPTMCRRFIPEEGTEEFAELLMDPDKYYLKMLPERFTATLGVALIEILSNHMTDEVYLGTRNSSKWTDSEAVLRHFDEFNDSLKWVEKRISLKNSEPKLKNRSGPAKLPYMLMYPDTTNDGSSGMTGKGIPNSVSI